MESQKDLGDLVTKHLKWNSQVLAAYSKANRMLGFLRRTAFDTHDQWARKLLYLSLVHRNLAYCSQVWAPQVVNLILVIERIQRRAAKFILSLPYRCEVSYKQRLLKIGLLPLCYWHEFLDFVYVFKCLVNLSDSFISVMNSTRRRRTVSSKGTLLTMRVNTVTFENSFYCRAPRIWNTLPANLRNTDCSVAHFKKDLFKYYLYLTKSVYDVGTPQTFKGMFIKCHTSRPWISLLDRMCCWFFIDVLPNSVFAFPFLFFFFFFFVVSESIVILVSCITNFLSFFLGLVVELALWVIQAS